MTDDKARGWFAEQGHVPGCCGGDVLKVVPKHAWDRAAQRTGFKALRKALDAIKGKKMFPADRAVKWHMPLSRGGYLVGSDAVAQTVLGPGMRPKPGSVPIGA